MGLWFLTGHNYDWKASVTHLLVSTWFIWHETSHLVFLSIHRFLHMGLTPSRICHESIVAAAAHPSRGQGTKFEPSPSMWYLIHFMFQSVTFRWKHAFGWWNESMCFLVQGVTCWREPFCSPQFCQPLNLFLIPPLFLWNNVYFLAPQYIQYRMNSHEMLQSWLCCCDFARTHQFHFMVQYFFSDLDPLFWGLEWGPLISPVPFPSLFLYFPCCLYSQALAISHHNEDIVFWHWFTRYSLPTVLHCFSCGMLFHFFSDHLSFFL